MKKLEEVVFDYAVCRAEVEALRAWLATTDELSERDDVLPFFKDRRHLAILFEVFNPRIGWADRFATEFDIFGDFTCDLAVGNWASRAYCFVELEDARTDSVFEKQGKKVTREWGRQFDHGYSQIIDWFHKLDGRSPSEDLLARFGDYSISYEAVLVIGRDKHMDEGEKQRLAWRSDKVTVNSKKVYCTTFDALLRQFSTRLTLLERAVTGPEGQGPPRPLPGGRDEGSGRVGQAHRNSGSRSGSTW
jgi:Shedu protein SduA, C-terminal